MHISATDLKNRLGQYLEAAIKEPVIVEKSGRPMSVVISYAEFQRLSEIEEQLWGLRALEAEKDGYLGVEKSSTILQQIKKRITDENSQD